MVEKLAALRHPARPGQSPAQAASSVADLTTREREVLSLVCQGKSDPEIATELKLARNTVRNHLASLYQKIGVNRCSALIVWARERGIGGDGVAPKLAKARKAGAGRPIRLVQNNQKNKSERLLIRRVSGPWAELSRDGLLCAQDI